MLECLFYQFHWCAPLRSKVLTEKASVKLCFQQYFMPKMGRYLFFQLDFAAFCSIGNGSFKNYNIGLPILSLSLVCTLVLKSYVRKRFKTWCFTSKTLISLSNQGLSTFPYFKDLGSKLQFLNDQSPYFESQINLRPKTKKSILDFL